VNGAAKASNEEKADYERRAVSVLKQGVQERVITNTQQLKFREFRSLEQREDFRSLCRSLESPRPG
jgi:hypothetical protein